MPVFLTREVIDNIHADSLALFGGIAGVRDEGLIESALGSAQNAWFYGRGDLFEVAAAYAFHLSQAQAFIDGNKRTGIAAALIFLEYNGVPSRVDDGTLYDAMIGIAERRLNKPQLAAVLEAFLQR
ncbi:MAG: type II toxin-antitoxin system death-on-curing family toxin [Prosthecobacter sp.]|uniref:type II toxin-antitoxin system death-on-curing family toxin n=1 Tax=Prosthecobacter sp. TaxID=1965333 RepID=UPI0025CC1E10|nr:type II toxin-antitoxin system death-on-curing family toxin [Prosthecobacter sp.]MCF7785807.1 type II toxin-antitoxin system death-on-curing family toxin [Prosthecobacter sp.]